MNIKDQNLNIIKASARYTRGSPRKARLVANSIVGLPADEAIARLALTRKKPAEVLAKLVKQAVANAKNNFQLATENLKVAEVVVGGGPVMKRMDRSHGARFDSGMLRKRFYHVNLVLTSPKNGSQVEVKTDDKQKEEKIIEKADLKSSPAKALEGKVEMKTEKKETKPKKATRRVNG